MKKFLKYSILIVTISWLILSTYLNYFFIKGVSEREFYLLSPFSIYSNIPLSTASVGNDLAVALGTSESEFPDRLQTLQSEDLRDLLLTHTEIYAIDISNIDLSYITEKLRSLYEVWPDKLKLLGDKYVQGIYVVRDLKSSAQVVRLTDRVYIIFVNETVLDKTPNEWIHGVETSTLRTDENMNTIEVIIENDSAVELTLENIIIHELGHIYGDISGMCPFTERHFDENFLPFFKNSFAFQFMDLVRIEDDLTLYDALDYYNNNQNPIRLEDYKYLAQNLYRTNYPTMYSSRNHYELFAECFYSYVHCILQNKPYQLRIVDDGNVIEINNGILENRMNYEKSIIENYFQN